MRYRDMRSGLACLLLSFLLAPAPPVPAAAPDPAAGWRIVGQIGGPTQAVAVQGQYAYVGVGLRLVVLDVSTSITPTEVGVTAPFPYFVEDIAISGTRAYVAAGGAGLRVVDISDPAHPAEIGAWDSPGYAEGAAVDGATVYLADGPYGLRAVDVSNPAHPIPVGAAYDMNYAFEVAVSGNHAYIAAAGAGLLIADVSNPARLVEVGTLDTPGYAYGMAGDREGRPYVYVADAWEGLQVVNVSDPTHPVAMGACDTPGWALNVAVAGSTAYVADGSFGLRVVDLSDPAHPHEVGAYEADGLARRVAVAGGTAFVADLRAGLRAIDVSSPMHPAQVGLYSPLTEARRAAVSGNHAYVAAGFSGLRIVDVSDPEHPTEIAVYDTEPGYAEAVVVSGTLVYVATGVHPSYNLHILDVSDPAHPVRLGAIPSGNIGPFRDIALVGTTLYAADEWGLRLYDVSDPTTPIELGSIFLAENNQATIGVAVSGTFAYVADAADRVKIVDIANPYSLTLVSVCCSNWHWVTGVAISGNTLYAAVHTAGLHIADVSNPYLPVEIGFYDTPGIAESVAVSGTAAYVSDSGGGLVVVDVSSPFSPTLVTVHDTPGRTWQTTVGNYAYVADGHGGLLILEQTAVRASGRPEPRSTHPAGHGASDPVGPPGPDVMTFGPGASRSAAGAGAGAAGIPVSSLPTGLLTTTHIVTSALDSGPGTLRQALLDAGPGDIITFDPAVFPPANPLTITLDSELPPITQGYLTIDASNAGVILNGSNLPGMVSGLRIWSDHNVVRGLQIMHFARCGIDVDASHNIIGGDRTQGIGPTGQGNVIGGNGTGIDIHGPNHTNNTVVGNLIGLDARGLVVSNREHGIQICCQASYNRIGGTTPGERNIISGNSNLGICVINRGVVGNVIVGNYIGTDVTGSQAIGNGWGGANLWDGASGNRVGGTEPGEGNLISGNPMAGIGISGIDANHNTVIGNRIGTDVSGTQPLGNHLGISLCGAGFNRVEGNVISGNPGGGIAVCDWGWPHSLIRGNYIGTDASGTQPLGNGYGIGLGGWHVLIEGNVISGNQGPGVDAASAGTEYNWIAGNAIGTDASGTIPLGNGWAGVGLWDYAAHSFVQGNTIAFNGGNGWDAGVFVQRSVSNTIRRNSIYSNVGRGIHLADGGNQMLLAPVILAVTQTGVAGTTCPGCTVEVFSDAEDEGRVYEGSTVADTAGAFAFTKPASLTGPYVTATVTDLEGNTSEFSAPQRAWNRLYLPLVLKG